MKLNQATVTIKSHKDPTNQFFMKTKLSKSNAQKVLDYVMKLLSKESKSL